MRVLAGRGYAPPAPCGHSGCSRLWRVAARAESARVVCTQKLTSGLFRISPKGMLTDLGMCVVHQTVDRIRNESCCDGHMKSTEEALEELGWRAFFSEQVLVEEALQCRPVRVMAVHRGKIDVIGAGTQHSIVPYIPDARPSDDHPTVGDWLLIDEVTLQPTRVLRRLNLFKRRAPGVVRKEQMIAANVAPA